MESPENSSSRIADLPFEKNNINMTFRSSDDRGHDMASASYMQMNVHQSPFGRPDMGAGLMPPPVYNLRPQQEQSAFPDNDPDYLGGRPTYPLSQRDVPMSTDDFRDVAAMPNYVPPPTTQQQNYVQEQEDRLRAQKISEHTKQSVQDKMDWVAQMQTPILLAILFWLFSAESLNFFLARYFSSFGLFSEGGHLNFRGSLLKSALFGLSYYGITTFVHSWEDFLG